MIKEFRVCDSCKEIIEHGSQFLSIGIGHLESKDRSLEANSKSLNAGSKEWCLKCTNRKRDMSFREFVNEIIGGWPESEEPK